MWNILPKSNHHRTEDISNDVYGTYVNDEPENKLLFANRQQSSCIVVFVLCCILRLWYIVPLYTKDRSYHVQPHLTRLHYRCSYTSMTNLSSTSNRYNLPANKPDFVFNDVYGISHPAKLTADLKCHQNTRRLATRRATVCGSIPRTQLE